MIFDKKFFYEEKGITRKEISMSISFCDGDEDFYTIVENNFKSEGSKITYEQVGTVCSDTYYAYGEFHKSELKTFLNRLHKKGIGKTMNILHSLKSFRLNASGKYEDVKDYLERREEEERMSNIEMERFKKRINEIYDEIAEDAGPNISYVESMNGSLFPQMIQLITGDHEERDLPEMIRECRFLAENDFILPESIAESSDGAFLDYIEDHKSDILKEIESNAESDYRGRFNQQKM